MAEDSVHLYWSNDLVQPDISGMSIMKSFLTFVPVTGDNQFPYIYYSPNCDSAYSFPGTSGGSVSKDINSFDGSGYVTGTESYDQSGATWQKYSELEYVYDNLHNRISGTQRYAFNGQSWDEANHYLYTYNAQNKVTQQIYQDLLSPNVWENEQNNSFTYNANNYSTSDTLKSWNIINWEIDSIRTYVYKANGLLDSVKTLKWNTNTSQWDVVGIHLYEYNAAGDNSSITYLNKNGHGWNNGFRFLYYYQNDLLDSIIMQNWDGLSNYENMLMYSFSYDNTYHQLIHFQSKTALTGGGFGQQNGDFEFYFRYEEFDNLGIKNTDAGLKPKIYPNPANDVLHFSMNGAVPYAVSIVDLSGKVIYVTHSKSDLISIPTHSFANGVYLIQWQSQTKKGSQAFCIEH